MKPQRLLLLTHPDNVPPDDRTELSEDRKQALRTEMDVIDALRGVGHEVFALGINDDLGVLRSALHELKPDISFNLLEEFHGVGAYDQNVVSYLELLREHYTGCNPRGLMLARDKALSKKLLAYHRISVPKFAVFPRGRRLRSVKGLRFPLLVKSLTEEASLGISQASLVHSEEKLRERVSFVHESIGSDAIAEEFIEGREIYVAVLGNTKLSAFPPWELFFKNLPEESPRIATERAKWSKKYQKKYGIDSGPAKELPNGLLKSLPELCKKIYRILNLSGYARIDFRIDANGVPHVLEANPNPDLGRKEDFALSAKAGGLEYPDLVQRIVTTGLGYPAEWKE